VAIAAQYRLAGQAGYPALVHDAKAAIRWVRANAKNLGIDPQRIAVVGYSAGGYHALFTAGTGDRPEFEGTGGNAGISTKVAACLAYYPASNVPANTLPAGSDAAARTAADAATYIAAGYPPIAIFHGMKDTTITIKTGNLVHVVKTGTAFYNVKGAVQEKFENSQETIVKNAIHIASETAHLYVQTATSIQLHVGESTLWMDSGGQIQLTIRTAEGKELIAAETEVK